MFDIVTSRDFYAMVVEDFDAFMDEPHSVRCALHCAISAYHLREWVWRDWLDADVTVKAALGIKTEAEFNGWINRVCPWFPVVRDLTNGTKHCKRDQGFETYRVTATPFALDQLTAGLDEGAWDEPVRYVSGSLPVGPYGKGYLLIDYGESAAEHRWQPAAYLLEIVVRFWRDFFRKYRAAPDLPASRHHVD